MNIVQKLLLFSLIITTLEKDSSIHIRKFLSNGEDEEVEIINSYNNTDELIKKFPVLNPTSVEPGIERNIQNRLLTGFENWNRGFKAWKAWGNILYTSESIYNVHGTRLTLAQYQDAMNVALSRTNIQMGAFHSIIICQEWSAIHYDFTTIIGDIVIPGFVMEFVKFKDYGDELGTRVVEGWGSTKDDSSAGMAIYQGPNERMIEQEQLNYMLEYEIPDIEDLSKKYPVIYPTEGKGDMVNEILDIILKGFDSWNQGIDVWIKWLYDGYSIDAENYDLNGVKRTITEYKAEMKTLSKKEKVRKIYFDNILITDNWAALHYRYTREDLKTGVKTAGDRMQFLKFEKIERSLRISSSWIQ